MIIGVRGEGRFEGRVITRRPRLFGQRNHGFHLHDRRIFRLVIGCIAQRLGRPHKITRRDVAPGQPRNRAQVLRRGTKNLRIDLCGFSRAVIREGAVGKIERIVDLRLGIRRRRTLRQLCHETVDLAGRLGTHEGIDRATIDETEYGGDGLNLKLTGDLLMLVDVDPHHPDLAVGLGDRRFELWTKRTARPAPWRGKLNDDGGGLRRFDNIGHEAGIRTVDDCATCRRILSATTKFEHRATS